MASKIRALMLAVKSAVQAVNGSPTYVHNLSGTGVVQLGEPSPGDGNRPPRVWIYLEPVVGTDGEALGQRKRTITVMIRADVPSTASSKEEHMLIACDVLDDITTALDADRSIGGNVIDLNVVGAPIYGQSTGLAETASAVLSVECYFHTDSGY